MSIDRAEYAPGDSIEVTLTNDSAYTMRYGPASFHLYKIEEEGANVGETEIWHHYYWEGPNPELSPRLLYGVGVPPERSVTERWRLDDDLVEGTYLYRLEVDFEVDWRHGPSSEIAPPDTTLESGLFLIREDS